MIKRVTFHLFLFFFIFWLMGGFKVVFAYDVNIISRNDFDIIANADNIAITKYDLNNFIFLTNKQKGAISNKIYVDSLENYIDILKKRIIAEKNKVTLTDDEKNNLWYVFSKNFNTSLSLEEFCKKNNLDENFVIYFFESNFLWYKYVETNLKQSIEIDEDTVNNALEFLAKKQYIARYNLAEIVLYFNNSEQRQKNLLKLENVYKTLNEKNFGITAFSMSQSTSAKNNGILGWLLEGELNENILKILKNTKKNSITNPFCVGNESGACFIFKLNDVERKNEVSEAEKNNVVNYIGVKIMNEKVKSILYAAKINVVIND